MRSAVNMIELVHNVKTMKREFAVPIMAVLCLVTCPNHLSCRFLSTGKKREGQTKGNMDTEHQRQDQAISSRGS